MRLLAATLILAVCATAPADDDKAFVLKSKDGRFSVTFPGKPTESTKQVPLKGTDQEITVKNHVLEVGKSAFIVAYNEYPAGVLAPKGQDVLKGVRDGNMGGGGKLVMEKIGTFGPNKLPMREVTFTKDKLHFRNKIILDGTRLYQVMIVSESANSLTNDAAKAYYESFKIIPRED
jgi:hypothetical protein